MIRQSLVDNNDQLIVIVCSSRRRFMSDNTRAAAANVMVSLELDTNVCYIQIIYVSKMYAANKPFSERISYEVQRLV